MEKITMRIIEHQTAPDFRVENILGDTISISAFQGKKILLSFYRHVGCPFSHLRFLELHKFDRYFKETGLVVIAVYESRENTLQRYSEGEPYYAHMIANPDYELYTLYDIEQSTLKILFSMYRGAYAKAEEGRRRFKQQFCAEGRRDTLGADFLIGEDGRIGYAYYNQYLGDHLPVKEIISFVRNDKIQGHKVMC